MTLGALISEPIFQMFLLGISALYALMAGISHEAKTGSNLSVSLLFLVLFVGSVFVTLRR